MGVMCSNGGYVIEHKYHKITRAGNFYIGKFNLVKSRNEMFDY